MTRYELTIAVETLEPIAPRQISNFVEDTLRAAGLVPARSTKLETVTVISCRTAQK